MAHGIQKVADRKKLEPRREPYWDRIRAGVYLGYRVAAQGAGTWIARKRDEDTGKQKYQALGHYDDYDSAKRAATEWADAHDHGVDVVETTVGDACRLYVEHLRLHKSENAARDAGGRFNALVYGKPIERVRLARLTTKHVRTWLNDQVVGDDDAEDEDDADAMRRAKKSANRNLDSLKAALNHALRDRLVMTDAGWKTVTRFKGVDKRRERFLLLGERTALLNACDADLADLCRAMLLTAARPGELANANVANLDPATGTLVLDGKTGRRTVTLSTAAAHFFKEQAKGHIGMAPLLRRKYGDRWTKDGWKKVFKRAALAAGLPSDVVLYSLRHAAISELIAGGMDSFVVARLAGTSTAMIDKHYGHLRHDSTRAAMDLVQMV